MATTTSNKRKKAVVATVAAAALLLGGTFAWTSISQQALNESAGVVNVGGRLHDDFDGENKDVYVENFTDPLDGGQPIYARVRLDEYMEVGQDAGGKNGNTDADQDGTPGEVEKVVSTADIDDVDTWTTHVPAENCTTCTDEEACIIHDHWEWEMGGQTTYMPTFNKNKDSLESDVNGTYHGTDDTDKVYYDDYVVYTEDSANGATDVPYADKAAENGAVYSVIGDEIYDDDTNGIDDANVVTKAGKTHVAKTTVDGTVITMAEWLEDPVSGPFWVYDEDGWAYWAAPIMPGEATGLLLSNINMYQNPGEKCYYGINVVGQFATVGDWEYFNGDEENPAFNGTDNALNLLQTAANAVPVVTIERTSGDANVEVGDTVAYKAALTFGGPTTYAMNDFDWKVYDADLNEVTSSTFAVDGETATLTIGEEEAGKNLIVAAYAQDYKGAVGLSSLAVVQSDTTAPTVDSIMQTGQFKQDITISSVEEADFPLTVTVYAFQEETPDYNDDTRVINTITLEKDGDSITYTEQPGVLDSYGVVARNAEIVLSEGVLSIAYNCAPGEPVFLGAKVADCSGNVGLTTDENLLFVGAAVGCFVAGTQVATADGLVNIEDIKLGDMVYSVNMETGEKELAEVAWVQDYRITPDTYTIYSADEKIVTTYEHPFYVEEEQDFVAAEDLEAGDTLKSMNGKTAVIEKIVYEQLDEPIPVYNFMVEGNHNYLVTEAELLVHNISK